MEMTIEDAIATIKGEKWICCQEKYIEAINLMENTMHKYQKIEEIVSNNELEWGSACARDKALLKVKKVVEDGQNTIKD